MSYFSRIISSWTAGDGTSKQASHEEPFPVRLVQEKDLLEELLDQVKLTNTYLAEMLGEDLNED